METDYTDTIGWHNVHHGRNIRRLREILGVKQEAIAIALDVTQQQISKLESKEEIEDETLEKIARVLKISPDAIKNYSEEAAMNFVTNTFHDNSTGGYCGSGNSNSYYCTFNPIDKIVELYERMLKMERERNKNSEADKGK